MRALVTGATGLVGSHLVRRLIDRRMDVRVLVRSGSDLAALAGMPVERATGDVRDAAAVRAAVRGCDWVFHVAARVSAWEKLRDEVWAVNVGGTENVIVACQAEGVKRLVHTSSAAAVGFTRDPADTLGEDAPWSFGGMGFLYQDSKRAAEDRVLEAARSGLPAVVCNPTLVFGAWDRHLNAAELLRMARRGRLLAYPPGGLGVVWAEDVAIGLVLAAERGRVGERYILNGENLPYRDLFRQISKVAGGPGTWFPLPAQLMAAASRVTVKLGELTGKEPVLTPSRAFVLSVFQYVSDHKARVELGYDPRLALPGIEAAAAWLTEQRLW